VLLATLALLIPKFGFSQPAAELIADSVDLRQSKVYVLVNKARIGHDHGVLGRLQSGTVHFNQQTNAGLLVFDLKSFAADSTEARKAVGLPGEIDQGTQSDVTASLLGPKVLDAARFGTATFTIDSALPAPGPPGSSRVRLVGSFTLHGVTKPLTLDCDVAAVPNGRRLRTQFKIKQTDYGITPFSKVFGAVGVADELTIWGDVSVVGTGG
jgi:polyisoprenoid-binding protein YceI